MNRRTPRLSRGPSYSRALRAFIAASSRYAEDQLAAAVLQGGVRQYVVLGAGLDTFAYCNPLRSWGLHVFEVDHPATQAWKRARLDQAGIVIPDDMTFAAANFETQSFDDRLQAQRVRRAPQNGTRNLTTPHSVLRESLNDAGFRGTASAFFSWLGVTPYLSRPAPAVKPTSCNDAIIRFIAGTRYFPAAPMDSLSPEAGTC
jgi:O-methyltransferase involved in polyketide biosynthesis